MMSAAVADASRLPRSLHVDVDEPIEAFDVAEAYLPPPLLVPLMVVIVNPAPLLMLLPLPTVSPYDADDETDLQSSVDVRILWSLRFAGPGSWPRTALLLLQLRYAIAREHRRVRVRLW